MSQAEWWASRKISAAFGQKIIAKPTLAGMLAGVRESGHFSLVVVHVQFCRKR